MNDPERMVADNEWVARAAVRGLFAPGLENQDLVQAARIGVWRAALSFDGHGSFQMYAWTLARRYAIDAVKRARAQKHGPLNDRHGPIVSDEGELLDVIDVQPDPLADPEEQLLRRERLRAIVRALPQLSPLERCAIEFSVNDVAYTTLPWPKRIDNALQRARKKLREAA